MSTITNLYDEYNKLRQTIMSVSTVEERIRNENAQEKIAQKIEHTLTTLNSPFPDFPYFTDTQFNAKLNSHSKYAVWTSSPASTHVKNQFISTDSQNFVKTFIHPNSPYRSLLIWHGTGVGKTCSAIGIAEQHKTDIFKRGKKIWIVCPKALISTWYTEIFNVFKALNIIRTTNTDHKTLQRLLQQNQCTRSAYTSIFQSIADINDVPQTERKMLKYIERYYRIINYEKFINIIDDIKMSVGKNQSEGKMIQMLKKEFNHAMLIIDEAHTIRKTYNEKSQTASSLKIIKSIRVPQGNEVKLINSRNGRGKHNEELTVRKDTSSFPYGFNGALQVQRVSGTGNIILYEKPKYQGKQQILSTTTSNLVLQKRSKSIIDVLRYITRHSDHLKLLLLSATPLYDNSSEILELINLCRLNDKRPIWSHNKVFPTNISLDSEDHPLYTFTRGYVSYVRGENPETFPLVIYPQGSQSTILSSIRIYESKMTTNQMQLLNDKKNISDIDPSKKMISTLTFPNGGYNNESFQSQFISSTSTPPFRQPLIKGKSIFASSTVGKYSPKYKNVLKNVLKSRGIVFIHTEYLATGAYTLAMMLEENGFSRYSSTKYPRPSMLNNVVRSSQSRKLGTYIIFDQSHAGEISMLLDVINAPENSHGEVVKVIIGTRRIEQGVSFKNVRQIHIMTPWWNMNRNKQIIGRGSRNLSHQALPLNERNVTVFYHVGKNKKGYSPDIGMYEKALEKQDTINAVEQILRKNSVDCLMNVALNQYTGTTRTVLDSFGNTRKITQNDIVTNPVQYTCISESFNTSSSWKMTKEIKPKVEQLYRKIRSNLFPRRAFVTKKNMISRLKKICAEHKIHPRIIPITLHIILSEVRDIYRGSVKGNLGFQKGYYLFIPKWENSDSNRYMTMLYRNIIPRKIIGTTKPINNITQNVTKRNNQVIVDLIQQIEYVPEYIQKHYATEQYPQKYLQKFILHRQMMLMDALRTDDRRELLLLWQKNQLGDNTKIIAQYFGTLESPSIIDGHVGRVEFKNKKYYRFLNRDGVYEYFEESSTKPLPQNKSVLVSAAFPHTTNDMKDVKYIGFHSYIKNGERSVLKIISSDSYSRNKKRKSGCICTASGLGKKPEVCALMKKLKKYLLGRNTSSNISGIHQSSKRKLTSNKARRTICEEIELLFRIMSHKDVQFISLRHFNIKKMN